MTEPADPRRPAPACRSRRRALTRAGGSRSARSPRPRAPKLGKTLTISNWPLYIDIDEKTKRRPTIDAVPEEVRGQGQVHRGHQRQRELLREDPGAARPRPVHGAGHHRADRQLAVSGAPDRARLGREARQERPAEHQEPPGPLSSTPPGTRTATYSLPWQSGMTGIGYDAKKTKPITSVDQLLTDKTAAREGDAADRDGGHDGARHARERRRPRQGHRRVASTGRFRRSRRRSSRARSASSPATTTPG